MSVFLRITRCWGSVASASKAGLASTATKQSAFPIGKRIWYLGVHMATVMNLISAHVKRGGKETSATLEYARIASMASAWVLMIANVFMAGKASIARKLLVFHRVTMAWP